VICDWTMARWGYSWIVYITSMCSSRSGAAPHFEGGGYNFARSACRKNFLTPHFLYT